MQAESLLGTWSREQVFWPGQEELADMACEACCNMAWVLPVRAASHGCSSSSGSKAVTTAIVPSHG